MLLHHWLHVAVGVASKDENARPPMRSADIRRRQRDRKAMVALPFQRSDHGVDPVVCSACDVLDESPWRAELLKNTSELHPESRALSSKARASVSACAGEVLAGESTTYKIHWGEVCLSDCSNVIEYRNAFPPLGKHTPAKVALLYLPNRRTDPGQLKAEVDASNSGEERAYFHRPMSSVVLRLSRFAMRMYRCTILVFEWPECRMISDSVCPLSAA